MATAAYFREWRKRPENLERLRKKARDRYHANREAFAARQLRYYHANPEKYKQLTKIWKAANPDWVKLFNERYKPRKNKLARAKYTTEVNRARRERYLAKHKDADNARAKAKAIRKRKELKPHYVIDLLRQQMRAMLKTTQLPILAKQIPPELVEAKRLQVLTEREINYRRRNA